MWGCKTVPQESNIFLDVPGETFTLSNVDDVIYFPRSITSLYGKVSYDIKGASPLKAFATDVRILIEELKTRVRRVK